MEVNLILCFRSCATIEWNRVADICVENVKLNGRTCLHPAPQGAHLPACWIFQNCPQPERRCLHLSKLGSGPPTTKQSFTPFESDCWDSWVFKRSSVIGRYCMLFRRLLYKAVKKDNSEDVLSHGFWDWRKNLVQSRPVFHFPSFVSPTT